jgi:hypothetical protein
MAGEYGSLGGGFATGGGGWLRYRLGFGFRFRFGLWFGLRQARSRLLRYLGPTRFARLDLGVRFGWAVAERHRKGEFWRPASTALKGACY